MGRYIQWDDVIGRYADAAQLKPGEAVNTYVVPDAEDEVDARLAVRYTVPFTPAPALVQGLCIDLAYYKLTYTRDTADKLWKYLENRFKALVNGDMILTTSAGTLGTTYSFASNSYRSAFGPDDPLNWSPSVDKQSDASDERTYD